MSKIIIANWKANPATLAEAMELFDFSVSEAAKYKNIQLIICPPFVYLEELAKIIQSTKYDTQNTMLGAQDLFWEHGGPYTGEVTIDMLKEFGVTHVLVGHSDRRYKMGESDEIINKKIKVALESGIIPVLLVGERNKRENMEEAILEQLFADLTGLTPDQIARILITYEPVWAISTTSGSEPDTPANTLEAIGIIKDFLTTQHSSPTRHYLYGGSINNKNVADFLKYPEIAGAVVGGASLKKNEFGNILEAVSKL